MPERVREAAGDALKIGKDAVAALTMEPRQRLDKIAVIARGLGLSVARG